MLWVCVLVSSLCYIQYDSQLPMLRNAAHTLLGSLFASTELVARRFEVPGGVVSRWTLDSMTQNLSCVPHPFPCLYVLIQNVGVWCVFDEIR